MTRTIKSETSNKHYFLTIDESGHAVDCTCGDQHFRCHVKGNPAHQCKHIKHYNAAYEQAVAFMKLLASFDVRSEQLVQAKRAAWWSFELAIAA